MRILLAQGSKTRPDVRQSACERHSDVIDVEFGLALADMPVSALGLSIWCLTGVQLTVCLLWL